MFSKPRLVLAVPLLALLTADVHAQAEEEFVLRSGRRIPAASVKPTGNGFTATLVTGASAQKVNFKASEIARASLREPAELAEARTSLANDKPLAVVTAMTRVGEELEPYREVPGGWWHRALILRMDAMATRGEAKAAAALADDKALAGLPDSTAAQLRDFRLIVAPPADGPEGKAEALKELSTRTTDPWISARAWLEVGTTYANHGKMEDAIKSWLRVAVFHPAERDLAVRGTILAARGLQQIERPQDGVKLLEDYLSDHVASPYASTIQTEVAKIDPKRTTDDAAPAADNATEENSN